MRNLLAAIAIAAFASPAAAESPWVIGNDNVKTECGACHMAFQAPFLPMRSWQAIMAGLSNHFGEDASLTDVAVKQDITDYLTRNAGDANGRANGWVRRIPQDQTPLRITELDGWIGAHSEEISPSAWKKVGSKSNCVACHQGAASGIFGDD